MEESFWKRTRTEAHSDMGASVGQKGPLDFWSMRRTPFLHSS